MCAAPKTLEKLSDGVVFHVGDHLMKLEVCADNIIRMAYAKNPDFFARKSLAAGGRHNIRTRWSLKTQNGRAILTTAGLQAHVDLASGRVLFFDAAGHPILAEKPAKPITLNVYAGADGGFTLYEDEGLTYDYAHGAFSLIPIRWNDAQHTLTISQREGSFKGMSKERTFNVVLITKNRPAGFSSPPAPERSAKYNGKPVQIKFD